MSKFRIIVFTSPDHVEDESAKIQSLIEAGVDYVHIRKPGSDIESVRKLLSSIPPEFRCRLRLHDYFELADEFKVGGIHINKRNPVAPSDSVSVSASFHSLSELVNWSQFEYVTFSPIFKSISKIHYFPTTGLESIIPLLKGRKVVALGGVTPDKFKFLKEKGFFGAALLGYIWNGDFNDSLRTLGSYISDLNQISIDT